MAKIIDAKTNEEVKISDGDEIREACEKLGVAFSCRDGICGTCMTDVVSGEENLSELTKQEKYLERDLKHRLACQCRIKKGNVVIEF